VGRSETTKQPLISIIIPAFNEESHIAATLHQIDEYLLLRPWPIEIIVVDDGSSDATVAEIERAAAKIVTPIHILKNRVNRGKGYSVRRGMQAANGDFVLFSDADLSTPIYELDRLLRRAQRGYDVVIGSRALRNSQIEVHQPLYREIMGKTFNLILRSLGLSHFHDTQCGFKLFSRCAVNRILPLAKVTRFAFDVEILLIAQRLGLRIRELPVHWHDSLPSKVSLVRDSFRMFFDVLRLRFRSFKKPQ